MQSVFNEWLDRFLVPIDDPGSRLFYLNILVTLIFMVLWFYFSLRQRNFTQLRRSLVRSVFNKKYWWNRSTKLDYKIYFLNSILKIFLFVPFLDFTFRISSWTAKNLLPLNGYEMMKLPVSSLNVFLFTIGAFFFDDLLRFIHHWAMHRVPFLWELHKTHHSARVLTPVTLYRTHPLESAMATVRNSISTGVAVGLFIFLFNSRFSLFTVFSVNVFGFAFNLLGSNLRHSHVPISFGFLENIFISPKQHQIHHSSNPQHFNKNYGVSLSLWDGIIGSRCFSSSVHEKLRFGVEKENRHTFSRIVLRSHFFRSLFNQKKKLS